MSFTQIYSTPIEYADMRCGTVLRREPNPVNVHSISILGASVGGGVINPSPTNEFFGNYIIGHCKACVVPIDPA